MTNATHYNPIGSDPILAYRLIKRLAPQPRPTTTKRSWLWWRNRNIVIDPGTL